MSPSAAMYRVFLTPTNSLPYSDVICMSGGLELLESS